MNTPRPNRIIDLDVTRAVALIGVVVMNYHGYLILGGGTAGRSFVNRVFNPWTGPLSTRFAATFVLIAGMGITLLTNRSRLSGDGVACSADRWTLIRRGVLLYGFGYVLNWIWDGTILFFYGALFVAGALLFTLRSRWIALVGGGAALAAAGLQWWRFERTHDGHRTGWLFTPTGRSPRGLLFDTFVNGTHPLLPWLAFMCAGIIVGRRLPLRIDARMLIAFSGVLLTMFTYLLHATLANTSLRAQLLATDPFNRSLNYTVGTLATALTAFCVVGTIAAATRDAAVTRALAATGRMTLTLYVAHVLVFNLVVHRLGWIRPTGLDTAWVFAGGFWVVAIVAASAWEGRFGMGPLERIYRRFGATTVQAETPSSANVPAH